MNILWLIVLAALGIFMLIKPELLWKLEHLFTVKGGEPSELYLALMRIGGAFFLLGALVAGIVLLACPLLD